VRFELGCAFGKECLKLRDLRLNIGA